MKFLILTGDDFGRNAAVNEAIESYHAAGALTQASLMVNEPAVEQAVRIAQRNPELCVGLHLTLCDGRAAHISSLTDRRGIFSPSAARAGWNYAFSKEQEAALSDEIEHQFSAFHALGFEPTYWDGHHHMHLHPTVLRLTLPIAKRYGFKALRLVREPYPWHPFSLVFRWLSREALPVLHAQQMHFVDRVYGLSRTGRVSTRYVRRVLSKLPDGWSELYFHPGAERAMPAPERFAEMLEKSGVQLSDARGLFGKAAPVGEPARVPDAAEEVLHEAPPAGVQRD